MQRRRRLWTFDSFLHTHARCAQNHPQLNATLWRSLKWVVNSQNISLTTAANLCDPETKTRLEEFSFFSVTLFLRRHLNCNPWKTNQQTSEDLSVANLVVEYFVGEPAGKKTVPLKTCVVLRKGQPNSRILIKNELQSAEETGQIYAQRASHSDWLGCGPTMVKLYTSWPIVELCQIWFTVGCSNFD